jgi:tetratricopeptide (TPR) repeat protein
LLVLSSKLLGAAPVGMAGNISQKVLRDQLTPQIGISPKAPSKGDEWRQQMQHALDLEAGGDFANAERTLTISIHQAEQPGSDPAWLPTALDRLGVLNWDLGRTRQAEQVYLHAADLWRRRFGPSNLGLATTFSDLAWVYVALGEPLQAKTLWQRSLEIRTLILGPYHPSVAEVYGYMAVGAFDAHRFDEAQSFCQQALRIYDRSGKIPGETDQVLSSLASVRLQQGRASEAIRLLTEAIQLEETTPHPVIRLVAGYFYNLALAESAAGRPVDAEVHFRRALSALAVPPYATQTLRCDVLKSYAHFLAHSGRKREAKTLQREAADIDQTIHRQSHAGYVVDISSF